MKKQSIVSLAAGSLCIAIVVIFLIMKWQGGNNDKFKYVDSHQSKPLNINHSSNKGRDELTAKAIEQRNTDDANRRPSRIVGWNWNELKPLDWTVDELDEFLMMKSKEAVGTQLASMMARIFPAPKGEPDSTNRIRSGSISLADQMRLCEKYLKDDDQPYFFAGLWATYRNSKFLEEYKREVIEKMPPGNMRMAAVGSYYSRIFQDYSSVEKFLESKEFLDLKESQTRLGLGSDYYGAVGAVVGCLVDFHANGFVSGDDVIAKINSSQLDESSKSKIARMIDKKSKQKSQSNPTK